MRLLVYSHDTFGLGNIKRMLAICTHLHSTIPGLSILIVSGSPMLHSFRVSPGIDYIKLPCLKRSDSGNLGVRYLDLDIEQVVRLRRELILSTVISFKPDIVLVDKKPEGLAGEMEPSLRYIRCNLPQTRTMLVLRDILDTPESTIQTWSEHGSYKTVEWYYDDVLVLGSQRLFDVCSEYAFPEVIRRKVHFCGYVARQHSTSSRTDIRKHLGIQECEQLLLITTGGGEDGHHVLSAAISAIKQLPTNHRVRALVVAGPELGATHAREVHLAASLCPHIQVVEFIDDMMGYFAASDLVVSMAGYNTICELLTVGRKAIIVPRVKPVEEQKIRAERMATIPMFTTILPSNLNPSLLAKTITDQLRRVSVDPVPTSEIDLEALTRISDIFNNHSRSRSGQFPTATDQFRTITAVANA